MLSGFTERGVITWDKVTPRGTVSIIRVSSGVHVPRKASWEEAILRIMAPPSELKMRKSDLVVSLGPNARGFCVLFSKNWTALNPQYQP